MSQSSFKRPLLKHFRGRLTVVLCIPPADECLFLANKEFSITEIEFENFSPKFIMQSFIT